MKIKTHYREKAELSKQKKTQKKMQIQFLSSKVFEDTLYPWNKNGETVKKQSEKERVWEN